MAEKNENFTVYDNGEMANIFLSNHVIEEIVAIAALDVDGIAIDYDTRKGREIAQKNTSKVLPRKVKVKVEGKNIYVHININIRYGYNAVEVSKKVQDKIKEKVEDMTSMKVRYVNVEVSGVRE